MKHDNVQEQVGGRPRPVIASQFGGLRWSGAHCSMGGLMGLVVGLAEDRNFIAHLP